jgi:hypothetical protein
MAGRRPAMYLLCLHIGIIKPNKGWQNLLLQNAVKGY